MLQFLKPPRVKDEELSHESQALHIILWTTIAVATLLSAAIFLLPDFLVRWLVIIGVAYALCISMLILNHRGYTRYASVILIAGLWALVSAAAFTGGGIAAPGTYFYLIIIFVAGFLRGPKAGVVTALVCTLTALSFVIIETNGYLLSPVVPHTPLTRWISLTLLVIFMVTLQYIAAITIRGSMQRIREELGERMRSEEALRESQARLKLAIEASNTGLWDWDIRTNKAFFSPEWKKQIGYEDDELPNAFEEWEKRLHPEDHDMTIKKLQGFLRDPATSFENEFRLQHKDGSYRWIYTHARVIRDDKRQPVRMLGSHVDITERKRVETEQAESLMREQAAKEQMINILESVSDAFVSLDKEWRYVYVNKKAAEIFNRAPETLIGKHIWTEFPEGVGQPFHRAYEKAMADQKVIELEEFYPPYDRWFENRIYPTEGGLSIFFHDITKRKMAEKKVHESEERYRTLAETATDAIVTIDRESTILFVNPAIEKVFGYGAVELVGQRLTMLMPEYLRRVHETSLSRYIETGKKHIGWEAVELSGLHKSGKEIPLEVSFGEFRKNGKYFFTGIIRDITERKHSEEALRVLERRFSIAFNSNPMPSTVSTLDGGRFLAANDRFLSTTGYTRDEVIGHTALELNLWPHPEDRVTFMQKLKEEGRVRDCEARLRLRNGEQRVLLLSVERIEIDGQPCLLHSANDITERKRAEEELRDAGIRYRTLVESTRAIFWRARPTLEFIYISPQAEEALGYPLERWTSERTFWKEHIHPDDREMAWSYCLEKIKEMAPHEFEYRMIAANGNIVWVRDIVRIIVENNKPKEAIGVIVDITERKQVEEKLRESEERFRRLSEATFEGIIIHDKGEILDVNQNLASMLGYEPGELLGQNYRRFTAPEYHDLLYARATSGYERIYEAVAVRKDGTRIPIELHGIASKYDGRDVRVTAIRDISARKRAEQELQLSYEQLRKLAEHLESVREEERKRIAREIHDELGQVLTAVKMDLTLLGHAALQGPIDDVRRQLQHDIKDDIELIDRSIQSVRRIATELRPEVLDELGFKSAIEWQANEFQTRTGIPCLCRTDTDDIALSAEASIALFRIVQEALTNISRHANATAVEIEIDQSARDLTVSIRDNGDGYSQQEKPEKKTLGLLGMRERAILLGGEFIIQSSPGNGTTVTVRVPV